MKTSEFQQLAVGDLVQVKPTGSGARFFGSRLILVGEVLALSAIPETRINSRPLVGRKSVLLPDGKEVFGALAIDAPTGTHVVIGIIKKIGWRSQDTTWQDFDSWKSTPRTYSYRQVITGLRGPGREAPGFSRGEVEPRCRASARVRPHAERRCTA